MNPKMVREIAAAITAIGSAVWIWWNILDRSGERHGPRKRRK